jgi:hypothetical protein
MRARAWAAPVDNPEGQLDAAAAGAELVELELEPSDDVELDFSDDVEVEGELVDSELVDEPLDEPSDELLAVVLADSRLSLR